MSRTMLVAAMLAVAAPALAQKSAFGTAQEAKAMLEKVIAAVKADKAGALEKVKKGEVGFKDRDLYPFCFGMSDGKMVGHPKSSLLGTDVRTLKDKAGATYGQVNFDLVKGAKEGAIVESPPYMFPRPGDDPTPVKKVSFMAKVGDVGCGVGYYKP